jgi:hypothetical protein
LIDAHVRALAARQRVFGAYASKITIVKLKRFPVLVLPVAGGVVFTVLLVIWWTSALWLFRLLGVGL